MMNSQDLINQTFLYAPIGMALVSLEGKWIKVNPALSQLTGYSEEELLGRLSMDLTVHEDWEREYELIKELLAGKREAFELEVRYIHKKGHVLWVKHSTVMVRENHTPLYFLFQIQEMIEKKKLDQNEGEEQFQNLLKDSPDPIMVHDGTTILYVNAAAASIVGGKADEMSDLPIHLFIDPSYLKYSETLIHEVLVNNQPIKDFEFKIRNVHGQAIDTVLSAVPTTYKGKKAIQLSYRDITDRKKIEQALKESEDRYRSLVEGSPEPIGILQDGKLVYMNQAGVEIIGATHSKELIGLPMSEFMDPESPELEEIRQWTQDQTGTTRKMEQQVFCLDHRVIDVELSVIHTRYNGRPAYQFVFRDITERKQAQEALKKSEEKLRAVIEQANDAIFLFSISEEGLPSNYIEVNQIASDLLGYSKEEFLAMSPRDLTPKERLNKLPNVMIEFFNKEKITFEGAYRSKNGRIIPFEFSARLLNFGEEKVILSIGRDITERKKTEEFMKQMAYYDYLTQLPNRRLFEDSLHETITKSGSSSIVIMFLDLDGFKQVNDQFGHETGDLLLQEVARHLTNSVRTEDLVARIAGDEFTVLLKDITKEDAVSVAERILDAFRSPIWLGGRPILISPSIGISFYLNGVMDGKTLMKTADDAMYQAKKNGKNTYCIYQENEV